MAGPTESIDHWLLEDVIQSSYAGNRNLKRVEEMLASRHCSSRCRILVVTSVANPPPFVVEREDCRTKRSACRVRSQRVVDAQIKFLFRQGEGPARSTVIVQVTRISVTNLCGEDLRLE